MGRNDHAVTLASGRNKRATKETFLSIRLIYGTFGPQFRLQAATINQEVLRGARGTIVGRKKEHHLNEFVSIDTTL